MASLKERVERHDREIAAIRKLITVGMKMLVKSDQNLLRLEGEQIALRKELRELAAAHKQTQREQQRTERMVQDLVRSLRTNGSNGHSERKN